MKTPFKYLISFAVIANLAACVDGQYGSYPNSGYPYPNYPTYPSNYPPPPPAYPPPAYYPPQDPYRYPPPPRYDNNGRWNDRNNNNQPAPVVVAPTPAPAPVIRPSCPAGTNFTGNSCVITDPKLRRPGGDGRINPCPSGMWVSGDRCVGK